MIYSFLLFISKLSFTTRKLHRYKFKCGSMCRSMVEVSRLRISTLAGIFSRPIPTLKGGKDELLL